MRGITLPSENKPESIEVTSVDDPSLPNENDLEYPDIDAIIKDFSEENQGEVRVESFKRREQSW